MGGRVPSSRVQWTPSWLLTSSTKLRDKEVSAVELATIVIREAIGRAGVQPADVGDVIMGCVNQAGEGTAGTYNTTGTPTARVVNLKSAGSCPP